ncbi:hypothetical protein VNO78_22383 [Psophocarpus tetragonolobus]|uniref:Uncharacterized protein n=1 Tax=Psophocarpus tetragonolobus TaxID=3891 RepID=A0AAN9XIY3_PSOTE
MGVYEHNLKESNKNKNELTLLMWMSLRTIKRFVDTDELKYMKPAVLKTKLGSIGGGNKMPVDRDHEVRDLKASLCDIEQKIFFERSNMKSEISKLLEKQTHSEEKFKEWECQCQSLEEEVRKINSEKVEMGETLKGEIELLKKDIDDRKKYIENVNANLDALKLERDNLKAEVGSLKEKINARDNEIKEAHKQVEGLTSRDKKLEEVIERQRVQILEGAEEKRELGSSAGPTFLKEEAHGKTLKNWLGLWTIDLGIPLSFPSFCSLEVGFGLHQMRNSVMRSVSIIMNNHYLPLELCYALFFQKEIHTPLLCYYTLILRFAAPSSIIFFFKIS